ncbi:MAG: Rrf2 family transcriptional regulator [Comamonadaceae bacterium]|nr:MAG: Rrf2 family transcriptional regulator [Comamonadaceae bacterium]
MRLTTKGRSAVTAMIDVALREADGPVSLSSLSARHGISLSYLELLFGKLRRADLVSATRGPGGGYSLARAVDSITVADIILAIEEGYDDELAVRDDVANPQKCSTSELWAQANRQIMEFLGSVDLRTLVDDQIAKGGPVRAVAKAKPLHKPLPRPLKVVAPNSVFALGKLAIPKR